MLTSTTLPQPAPALLSAGPDQLIPAIQHGDPAAALALHSRYAAGIAFYLRRKIPTPQIRDSVLEVLLDTIRIIKDCSLRPIPQLTAIVLHCTKRHADQATHYSVRAPKPTPTADLNLNSRSELVNRIFTSLPAHHREILMRTYLLRQDDATIACEMRVSRETVTAVRTQTRGTFLALSAQHTTSTLRDNQPAITIN